MNYYPETLPSNGQLAIISITRIDNLIGYYGTLVEYANQEVFISINEIKLKRNQALTSVKQVNALDVVCIVSQINMTASKRK